MSEPFSADPYVADRALKNKLGITDQKELERAEADIATVKIAALEQGKNIPGKYDLEHLCKFHKYIFRDVYPWAGEVRTVDISKRKSFASVRMIPQFSQEVFGKLEKANHLKGLSRENFVSGLVDAYGDINALHPFREGNGRAQRAFLSQMSRDAGYVIDWRRLDSKELRKAAEDIWMGRTREEDAYKRILDPLVSSKPKADSATRKSASKKPSPGKKSSSGKEARVTSGRGKSQEPAKKNIKRR